MNLSHCLSTEFHTPLQQNTASVSYDHNMGEGGEVGKGPLVEKCRASLKLAPKRQPKFPVPLYIPYFFMGVRLIVRITQLKQTMAAVIC